MLSKTICLLFFVIYCRKSDFWTTRRCFEVPKGLPLEAGKH
jgi:hypothetical protein